MLDASHNIWIRGMEEKHINKNERNIKDPSKCT